MSYSITITNNNIHDISTNGGENRLRNRPFSQSFRHFEVCLWEEILSSIKDTIRSFPSLSVIDLRPFELAWKMQSGRIWSPIKQHVMGDIANIACAYDRKSCSLSNDIIYFFHDSATNVKPCEFSGNAFWAIFEVPKWENENESEKIRPENI